MTKLLETNFPKLVDYTFTAEMENGLDRIAHGEETGRDWLTHFYFGSGEGAARNADEAHEGLQQQVAQLGEIDARAINTIDIGDGIRMVREAGADNAVLTLAWMPCASSTCWMPIPR